MRHFPSLSRKALIHSCSPSPAVDTWASAGGQQNAAGAARRSKVLLLQERLRSWDLGCGVVGSCRQA